VVCLALLSTLVFSSCGSSDVDKAKEFMAARMYPQAIELLNKRISEKPDDAEAHFQLGVCYINTGNYRGADERFASAVSLKFDFGHQIGGEYRSAGLSALDTERMMQAKTLMEKAIQYQPDLRAGIAQDVLAKAKQGQGDTDTLFSLAASLDESLKEEVGDHYYTLSQQAEGVRSVVLLKQANTYSGKHSQELGQKLLALAREKPKKDRKLYIDQAKKYLAQEEIDKVFAPPTWEKAFRKVCIGQGMGEREYVKALRCGVDYNNGDKVNVFGDKFLVWSKGEWRRPINGTYDILVENHIKGKYILIRNPKGEEFTVEVQRLKTSY
jgi:tetratricopeptide (TPR) repeat protein